MLLVYAIDARAEPEDVLRVARRRLASVNLEHAYTALDASERLVVGVGQDELALAKAIIGEAIDFRIALVASDDPAEIQAAFAAKPVDRILAPTRDASEPFLLLHESQATISWERIRQANVGFSQGGNPTLTITFGRQGAEELAQLTTAHVGQRFALIVNGEVIVAPRIAAPITDGAAVVDGAFTVEEAQNWVAMINAAAVQAPLTLIQETSSED